MAQRRGFEPLHRVTDLHAFQACPFSLLGISAFLEQAAGIEPVPTAWEAGVLPLNYACIFTFELTAFSYEF